METHSDLSQMSFCGIVQHHEAKQQVADPTKILAKFAWTPLVYAEAGPKTLRMLNVCKALSYAHAYPHLPVVRPFMNYVLRVTQGKIVHHDYLRHLNEYERINFMRALEAHNSYRVPKFEPLMQTRLLVEKLYKVSVDQQLAAEQYLDGLSEL